MHVESGAVLRGWLEGEGGGWVGFGWQENVRIVNFMSPRLDQPYSSDRLYKQYDRLRLRL